MSEQKVPLPEPVIRPFSGADPFYFTEEQLQSYGDAREQAGWNAAIEWAARQWEDNIRDPGDDYQEGFNVACCRCTDAIREGMK